MDEPSGDPAKSPPAPDAPVTGEPDRHDPPETPRPPPAEGASRTWWIVAGLLVVVFLAAYVPLSLKARKLGRELELSEKNLQLARIQITLANAALDARRGEYEQARQGAADFFAQITDQLEQGSASCLPAGAREHLQPLLKQRDNVITLLARGDPASAERMADLYAAFRRFLAR